MDAQQETDPTLIHRPFPLLKRYSLPWVEEQIARKVCRQPYNVVTVSRIFRRSLSEAEAALMLGGDNYTLDNSNPGIHFRLGRLAVKHKLPSAIWGASVGPFTSDPEFERWAANELRHITLICARETETQEYLAGIGVEENVILAADPAFVLQPSAVELPTDIEEVLAEGCIGLNLSPLICRFMRFPGSRQHSLVAWAQVATEVVRCLASHFSLPILLIPHVTSETGDTGRDDYLFLQRVAQLVQEPEQVFVLEPDLNAAQTKWVIGRVRVFAGARTHSTLAAISSGVPTVCIGYSMKSRGIAKDVYGHLEWLIKSQDLVKDPAALRDRLISLQDQETEIRSHLKRINPIFEQRVRGATRRFVDIIEQKSRS